jgi:hypothetical protein
VAKIRLQSYLGLNRDLFRIEIEVCLGLNYQSLALEVFSLKKRGPGHGLNLGVIGRIPPF